MSFGTETRSSYIRCDLDDMILIDLSDPVRRDRQDGSRAKFAEKVEIVLLKNISSDSI